MNWIPQVFIALFGVAAIWLVGCTTPRVRRWGFICGIVAQPFWMWTSLAHEQYGIALLCLFYTTSWVRGAVKNWSVIA